MVLIVVSIGLGIGLPSLQSSVAGSRTDAARSRLTVALAHARNEAVMRAADVVVCPGNGNGGCADTIYWQRGWISFIDLNRNGARDTDEPELGAGDASRGVGIVSTQGRRAVRYRPDGSSEGTNITLTFCDARGAGRASALALNNAGRLRRVAAEPSHAATACGAIE